MDFVNIPKKYRPIPFWSWNEKLETKETEMQIDSMKKVGFGGYFMHARGGLQTEYMGKEWFDNISSGVEQGKKLDMSAWAYDENGWPSGFGNGIVNGKGVRFQQKCIRFEHGEKNTETTIANVDGYHFYYEVNPFYVDLLDGAVTKLFLEEIYEVYYKKYGNGLEGFFTDEPQLSRRGIPWSFVLEEEYKKEYNEDLLCKLPELFFNKGDYQTTRLKFWRLVTKLLANNFTKQVFEWCEKHNLKFTGHMVLEETLGEQLTPNGAVMPNYRYFHIPGMDCLGRQKINKKTIYQVASVAQQFGKEQVLSETFALTGWNVSFEELKQMYEWQMVRGVNLLCPHLSAYSLRGVRKRDYPAVFSYQEPWWDKFNLFVDSMSRIGMLLTKGRPQCDTLLIHPQSTAWALFDGNYSNPLIDEYDLKLNNTIDELEKKHILFHLGDEIIIEENAKVEGNMIVIGNQRYTTVVLPPHIVLFDSTKRLLKTFENNGGVVLNDTEGLKTVDIVDDERIVYTKRVFDDFDLYYFVNTTDEIVNVNIKEGTHCLDIKTGEELPFTGDYVFEPSGSLVVLDHHNKSRKTVDNHKEFRNLDLSGEWDIKSCDYNAITLDYCRCSFDGKLIGENFPVISVQDKACALGRKVDIEMEFNLKVEDIPDEVFLVCETPEIFTISVNGKKLENTANGYYWDKSFKKIDLSGCLINGDNEIILTCVFEQSKSVYDNLEKARKFESELNKLTYDMEIENIYIVGNFAVRTDGTFKTINRNAVKYTGDFIIKQPAKKVMLKNIEQQGFPFFSGSITLSKTLSLTKGSYHISFDKKLANIVSVKVNGKQVGDILWKPYSLDLTEYINDGINTIELVLVSSLRNLLGPHHIEDGESYEVTPACFFKDDTIWGTWHKKAWDDSYCFVMFGIN